MNTTLAKRLPSFLLFALIIGLLSSKCYYTPDFYKPTYAPVTAFYGPQQVRLGASHSGSGLTDGYIAYSPLQSFALAYSLSYKNSRENDSLFRKQYAWEVLFGGYHSWGDRNKIIAELYAGYGQYKSNVGEMGFVNSFNGMSQDILYFYDGDFSKTFIQANVILRAVEPSQKVVGEFGGFFRLARHNAGSFHHEQNHSDFSLQPVNLYDATMLSAGAVLRVGTKWGKVEASGALLRSLHSTNFEYNSFYFGVGFQIAWDFLER